MKHSVDKIFRSTYQNHRLLHLVPKQGLPRYIFSFAILITRDALTLFGGDLVTQWCPTLCNPWTVACQASLSMGFPRQEYCRGLPFLLQGIFPTQGANLRFLCISCASPALTGRFFTTEPRLLLKGLQFAGRKYFTLPI